MRIVTCGFVLLGFLVAPGARAGNLTLFNGLLNADGGAAAPLGIDPTLAGPGGLGGGAIEGDVLVTAPFDGALSVSVQDQGTPGNVFQVVLDGAPLGLTAPVVAGGGVASVGTFPAPVLAGVHDVGLWDFVLTYLGQASPYGGTVGDAFATPQPVLLTISEIPEPGALALSTGAMALVVSRRRAAGRR